MKRLLQFAFFLVLAAPLTHATTWFVRSGGSDIYNATARPYGGCNGKYDVDYPGTTNNSWGPTETLAVNYSIVDSNGDYEKITTGGTTNGSAVPSWPSHGSSGATTTDGTATWTSEGAAPYNQNCAVNDSRWLYMNGPGNWAWLISGGDTVVIRGCKASGGQQNPSNPNCRVGNDVTLYGFGGGHGTTGFCAYAEALPDCTNPPIPAGTSGAHTRILGGCAYDSTPGPCNTGNVTNYANLTQLFGGWDVYRVIDARNTQYVDIEGLELTDHNNCIIYGNGGLPSVCATDGTEDYAQTGIYTNNTTANLTLQDLYIHGFPVDGLFGAIGGHIAMTRVAVNDNGFAGWNFDDTTADGPGASITASYVTMQFNGCNEEYPIVDPIPLTYCYTISTGGFGDAWSGQDAYMDYFTGDHLTIQFNTKDGFFGPHTSIGAVTVTNSFSQGNAGTTWKGNPGYNGTWVFRNNLVINSCARMQVSLLGAPSTYNTTIGDFCRYYGEAMQMQWPVTGSFDIDGNTFIAAGQNGLIDFTCAYQMDTVQSIVQAGSGYQVGDVLLLGGIGAKYTVSSINGSGGITGGTLTNYGQYSTTYYAEQVNGEGPVYIAGGHGTGAQIGVSSSGPANCGQGPRTMHDNIFYGITNPLAPGYNDEPVDFICYSVCDGTAGNSNDSQWTSRGYNIMYAFQSGFGACTYPNESCSDPKLLNEPPTTMVNLTATDVFNPAYPSNSYLLTGSSPALDGGTPVSGLTTDFYGATRPSPPSIGGVEYSTSAPTGHTLTTSTTGGAGTVNCGPFSSIPTGTTVICAATPSSDTFTGWSGSLGLTGTYSPTSGIMPASTASVIAAFSGTGSSTGSRFIGIVKGLFQ